MTGLPMPPGARPASFRAFLQVEEGNAGAGGGVGTRSSGGPGRLGA